MGGMVGYQKIKQKKLTFIDWIEEALYYLYLAKEEDIIKEFRIKSSKNRKQA